MTIIQNPDLLKARNLQVQFTYDVDAYGAQDTIFIDDGLAITAAIETSNSITQTQATLRIIGLPRDTIERLTVLNYFNPFQVLRNKVKILAGYDTELATIFEGEIMETQSNLVEPNHIFECTARTGWVDSVKRAPHTNTKGETTAFAIFDSLARQINRTYVDRAQTANIKLFNHILTGSVVHQIEELADQVEVEVKITPTEVITIRESGLPPGIELLISPTSGMIGNPRLNNKGVVVRTRFDPRITWYTPFRLESEIPKTSGNWRVYSTRSLLENLGNNFWIDVEGVKPGFRLF